MKSHHHITREEIKLYTIMVKSNLTMREIGLLL